MESIILLGDDVNLNLILPNDKPGFLRFILRYQYLLFWVLLVGSDTVTFRKVVTPWLPFRRPASTVASDPDRDHQLADRSRPPPVDASTLSILTNALD